MTCLVRSKAMMEKIIKSMLVIYVHVEEKEERREVEYLEYPRS